MKDLTVASHFACADSEYSETVVACLSALTFLSKLVTPQLPKAVLPTWKTDGVGRITAATLLLLSLPLDLSAVGRRASLGEGGTMTANEDWLVINAKSGPRRFCDMSQPEEPR